MTKTSVTCTIAAMKYHPKTGSREFFYTLRITLYAVLCKLVYLPTVHCLISGPVTDLDFVAFWDFYLIYSNKAQSNNDKIEGFVLRTELKIF